MGLRLNVDLETNQGPSREVYVRIDNWKINRATADIVFTTTSWLDQSYADKFLRQYYDEPMRNSIGLISSKVIYYENDESEGTELLLDNLHKLPMAKEIDVEIPVYEKKKITKEVPYVSFDENGDEITLYRTIIQEENVEVGVNIEKKQVIDHTILNNLESVCYEELKLFYSQYFPIEKIEII